MSHHLSCSINGVCNPKVGIFLIGTHEKVLQELLKTTHKFIFLVKSTLSSCGCPGEQSVPQYIASRLVEELVKC